MTDNKHSNIEGRVDVLEAINDSRYEELRKDIQEIKVQQKVILEDIKSLSGVLSKGSGAIGAIFIIGTIIAGILGLVQIFKGG